MEIKKTADSIKYIKEVQCAVELAMQAVISYLESTENPTSEEAHELIDKVLKEHNCESPEGHIVSGGVQSAEPHEEGTGVLDKGVPIIIDIYPRSKTTGYFADMSRTVCIGIAPTDLQKMYDTVLAAQKLAISMIKPKVQCRDIQKSVEVFFSDAGYKTYGEGKEFPFAEGFVHALGHGVGRNIHESPFIKKDSEDVLEEGDVITIEPGLYYKNIGGIRLEDMILVTSDGYENLTSFPKKLVI